jgi:hypothetical protein
MIKMIDKWSAEFDLRPAAGAYASMDAIVAEAAALDGVLALPEGGVAELPDPDNSPPAEASEQWWVANIAQCRAQHQAREVVIGGHGYRKPWEQNTFTVPAGTTLVFYIADTSGLAETLAVELASGGSRSERVAQHVQLLDPILHDAWELEPDKILADLTHKRIYGSGAQVYDYTVTPPEATDQPMAVCVTVGTRMKLSTLIRPALGEIHIGFCRLIDWYGGFSAQPVGSIHRRPGGWRYVRKHEYVGYEGPQGQHPPEMQLTF